METNGRAIPYQNKSKFYHELHSEVRGLLEKNWISNLANISALLKQHLPEINWVGFYLAHEQELFLSSFQGLPACTRIAFGKGVCGTAAQTKATQRIADVDRFPGHIVCDSASQSEIVIPLIVEGRVRGVLDVDSPRKDRFDEADQRGLEEVIHLLVENTLWPADFI
jgi:L-methionine (R)-S-oxide reductase